MRTEHLKNISNKQLAKDLAALIRWIPKERLDISFMEKIQGLIDNVLLEIEFRVRSKWFLPHIVRNIDFLKNSNDFEESLKILHETEKLINSEI